jgi:hypothetical protein
MSHDPTDEMEPQLAQAAASLGIKQQVISSLGRTGRAPEAAMDMRATASLIQEGLGSKRGNHAMLEGNPAHGLAHQQCVIRSA